MTIKEFFEIVIEDKIPLDAEIFVYADHGQDIERGYAYNVTRQPIEGRSGEEIIWECENMSDVYDDIEDYPKNGEITAVCIAGE